jgi:hypothetical protein
MGTKPWVKPNLSPAALHSPVRSAWQQQIRDGALCKMVDAAANRWTTPSSRATPTPLIDFYGRFPRMARSLLSTLPTRLKRGDPRLQEPVNVLKRTPSCSSTGQLFRFASSADQLHFSDVTILSCFCFFLEWRDRRRHGAVCA